LLERAKQWNYESNVLLAELYTQPDRHRDAARIRWDIFERVPHRSEFQEKREGHYRALLHAAEPLTAVESLGGGAEIRYRRS
jgi:hypothetical protein